MTEFMADDDLSMNRVNPYTATGTFGISYDGATYPEMQWNTPVDGPATWNTPDKNEADDHLTPLAMNTSGPMYLKTADKGPATSFMFPARKFQYDDGTTSWSRETIWRNGENYTNEKLFGQSTSMHRIFLFMMILLLVLFVAAKVLKV
jgi:hypothetical protein